MNYLFNVNDEIIKGRPDLFFYTGNIGTYNFCFEFSKIWNDLIKFAVFITPKATYTVKIENNNVTIPAEILITPGIYSFGVYGTTAEDDIRRISSNLITFEVLNGAYADGQTPAVPTPDIWETLFMNSIPVIKDGNWYLYNIEAMDFVDTGVPALGPKPQKGVDYWTDEDRTAMIQDVISSLSNGDEVSY